MVSTEELAAVPLFSGLDEDQLAELATRFNARDVGEDITLVGEGSPGYTFFVLAEGTAVVTAEGERLAELGPGDFFGELAILGAGRRTATVTSTTPVRILFMFGSSFREMEAAHPEIASRIAEEMEARLAGARHGREEPPSH